MRYLLALDEGTTSARAIVFDQGGALRGLAQYAICQHLPQPGWVEHDAEEIWQLQARAALEALGQAGIDRTAIAAVGITNQRETTVLWDRTTGQPIHRAIVWQDRRTAGICEQLQREGHENLVRERTGLVIDPYFSGTKVTWMLDQIPGARARAEAGQLAFGTIDCWLLWKLTGGKLHVTDASNASRTLLYNIHTGQWDEDLLRLLRVPRALLPEVRASSAVYGPIISIPELADIPIAGMGGDQQAALFGQLCTAPGLTKNTYGTGCFMLQNTGTQAVASSAKLLTTVAWKIGDRTEYALEGSVFIGGAVVQWLRDGLGLIETAEEIERLAASVSDNGGVFLVPAFAGLGAPHWDPYARGALLGITRGTTAGHLARAGLESIAYQVADLLDAMHQDAGVPLSELRVDGGASKNDMLLQFQADILRVPVVRPTVVESTALGAAYLAGLAVGYWKSPAEIAQQRRIDRRFEPAMPEAQATALRRRWQDAVQRAKGWAAKEHS